MDDGETKVVEKFHGILASGTLGGGLIEGKTFFFLSYEGLRLRLRRLISELRTMQDQLQQLKVRFASAFDSGILHSTK